MIQRMVVFGASGDLTSRLLMSYAVNPDARLSWGGLPAPGRRPQLSPAQMHVI